MDVLLAVLLVFAIAALALTLTMGGSINPNDGKHDWLKYEMLGRPRNCKECFTVFVVHEFDGIKNIRCPKKRLDGDRHEHFRWHVEDETEWNGI
jgi:hypothetical protein